MLRTAMAICAAAFAAGAQQKAALRIDWERTETVCKTVSTLQVVVNPMLRRGSPIHDAAFQALRDLGADYVRYVPWLPYPRLAVAELEPPSASDTHWDFQLIDPMTKDFLDATTGHPVILNFSTIPAWLFKTDEEPAVPDDPDQASWNYTRGTELEEGGLQELGQYYARLVSWYTQGGFTDELGTRHESGYHYDIPYWEVFNEPDLEHRTSAERYTERYDEVVSAIRAVAPKMKFVGLALAFPEAHPEMFEYFLNPANHRPGIPIDMISYHFYATPATAETDEHWQYTMFDQMERLVATVRYVEQIRKRLSPATRTTIDEVGSILPTDWQPETPNAAGPAIPPVYWNASGALYADVYLQMAKLGIDAVGESQLVGYPSQYPSVTMIDWKTGKPNARYWVLKLIHDNFAPGDRLAATTWPDKDTVVQAFVTKAGRKLLLINKRDRALTLDLAVPVVKGSLAAVDGGSPAQPEPFTGSTVTLRPFAVAVLSVGD